MSEPSEPNVVVPTTPLSKRIDDLFEILTELHRETLESKALSRAAVDASERAERAAARAAHCADAAREIAGSIFNDHHKRWHPMEQRQDALERRMTQFEHSAAEAKLNG